MFRILTAVLGLLLCVTTVQADEKSVPATDAASKQFKVLIDEFEADGNARESAGEFIKLAERHPQSSVAVDALTWVVVNVSRGKDLDQADHTPRKGVCAMRAACDGLPEAAESTFARVGNPAARTSCEKSAQRRPRSGSLSSGGLSSETARFDQSTQEGRGESPAV
ncbi:MAG: hypothetical protein O3C17_02700 [Planctomycetota bacterium]|nr:hypothetical protein [Planctomycetota bacterium]